MMLSRNLVRLIYFLYYITIRIKTDSKKYKVKMKYGFPMSVSTWDDSIYFNKSLSTPSLILFLSNNVSNLTLYIIFSTITSFFKSKISN